MQTSDVIGFVAFGSFGVWWLLSPRTVLRFYGWFHRGRAGMPGPAGVRIAGVLWLAIIAVVFWQFRIR